MHLLNRMFFQRRETLINDFREACSNAISRKLLVHANMLSDRYDADSKMYHGSWTRSTKLDITDSSTRIETIAEKNTDGNILVILQEYKKM